MCQKTTIHHEWKEAETGKIPVRVQVSQWLRSLPKVKVHSTYSTSFRKNIEFSLTARDYSGQ